MKTIEQIELIISQSYVDQGDTKGADKAKAVAKRIGEMLNLSQQLPSKELYEKVYLKSTNDLPDKEDEYFCNRSGFKSVQRLGPDLPERSYIREIKWFLKPLKETTG